MYLCSLLNPLWALWLSIVFFVVKLLTTRDTKIYTRFTMTYFVRFVAFLVPFVVKLLTTMDTKNYAMVTKYH